MPDDEPGLSTGAYGSGRPWRRTGGGDTDCTLDALHTAAASLAGPGTWALVGTVPAGTGGRGQVSSTCPRSCACVSRAVNGCNPNVDSISFSVEVCSNGPWCTTRAWARLDTTIAGTRKPSC